jgi:monofunctional biosynthetic peptidoglycan transglycosylase
VSVTAIAAPAAVEFEAPTQPVPALPLHPPPPLTPTIAKPVRPRWRVWLRRALLALFGLATGYAALVLILIVVYRTVDPPRSTVMLGVNLSGVSVDYEPVPLSSISTYLLRAVVTSEDARFCSHGGVDWGALAEAMQDSRGGSTITMQTAKNLFLWPSRSYIRKAIEIPMALLIDFAWPKRRILEVYLNIAEWGPGIFGAEAAAQYHFNKSASRLTQQEATLLAASLPNPIAREAGDPGRITALLASRLRARMANSDAYVGCLGLRPMPRAEPERTPKPASAAAPKSPPKAQPWQTKTEPAKPPTPFNPWQN